MNSKAHYPYHMTIRENAIPAYIELTSSVDETKLVKLTWPTAFVALHQLRGIVELLEEICYAENIS